MREDGALGPAGGPGRVLHVDDIIAAERRLALFVFLAGHLRRQRHDLRHRVHAPVLLRSEEQHPLQVREPVRMQLVPGLCLQFRDELVHDVDVIGVPVAIDDEDVLAIGLFENVLDLGRFVIDVDGEQDRPDLRGGEL